MASLTGARRFVDDTVDEMKKVTWPDWPQLRNSTFVMLVFVLIVSGIIWIMDLGVRGVLRVIFDVFV